MNEEHDRAGCPGPDEIWALCHGDVHEERVEPILRHALDCGLCRDTLAAARRAAAGEADESAAVAVELRSPAARRRYLPAALAAAAILVLAVLLPRLGDRFETGPAAIRGTPPAVRWVDLGQGRPRPREAFELRWQPVAGGVTYDVDVLSGDLELLDRSGRLGEPVYIVEPSVLETVAAEGLILWRVQARLVSGEQVQSPIFRTPVAR